MKTRLVAALSWLAATCTATVLVAGAVGAIRDTTRRDTSLVAAVTPDDRVAAATSTMAVETSTGRPATVAPTTTTAVAIPAAPAITSRGAAAPDLTTPPTGAARATTTALAGATNGPAPTTAPPATVAPTTPTTPTTTSSTTRTIASVGGTVTVRFSPSAVTVVAATPNAGFTARVDQRGTTAVRVEFTAGGHKSRVEAWWADGPQEDVREG